MTVGSPSSRFARLRSVACLTIILCVLPLAPSADNTPKPTILWTQKLPEKVLAIVNVDANRITIQEPGEESLVTANMLPGSFGRASFRVLGAPTGVLLLAVRDNSPFVQLLALDTTTGRRLWQIPCTSLPVSGLRQFLPRPSTATRFAISNVNPAMVGGPTAHAPLRHATPTSSPTTAT